ncbi:hypothetical protein CMMCAS04_15460 [Clavibacter michiganensis subsp. michiganensis]|nr:hypothetical protein CMMCAS04_15460 [Clavibacter michiganensis subsp. michiganensis]
MAARHLPPGRAARAARRRARRCAGACRPRSGRRIRPPGRAGGRRVPRGGARAGAGDPRDLGDRGRRRARRDPRGRRLERRAAAPLRRDRVVARGDREPADRLPHGAHRRRRAARRRPPPHLPRREPARVAPRARPRVRRGRGARRPGADEAERSERDPHLALPAASAPDRHRRRARLVGRARVRPRDARLLGRRVAGQPVRRPALARRLPRPHRAHRRPRPQPPVDRDVVARQRVRHRAQHRGHVGVGAARGSDPSRALRGRPHGRAHRRLLAHVPDARGDRLGVRHARREHP